MATDIVQSLFGVTPASYQQAQQDRADAQAMRFAQLDPFQQANYAIGRGAYGLAGAVGGALGGQDPELQRISMRQQIAGQIDFDDDDSMKRGILALSQGGDPQGAMQLQQILLNQQAKRASIGKDEAAGLASLAQASRERAPPTTTELTNARAVALRAGVEGSPEYNAAFDAAFSSFTTKPENKEPTTNELTNARAFALRAGPVGSPEYNAELQAQLTRLTAKLENDFVVVGNALVSKSTGKPVYEGPKPEKISAFAQELIDAGLTPGTEPFQKRMLEYTTSKIKGAAIGTGNVNLGGINIDTGAAAKAAGTVIGTGVANIEQQYALGTAFKDALTILGQGIYGGAYGPEKQFLAKFVGIGDPKKVQNTEVFLANIGEIVIPRLQQFGGNDSNEELKYLQKVVAGDQRLEPEAVKRILASAERKVNNNLARLRAQASTAPGAPLPTAPITPTTAPTPTKRYNPQTRKIEAISGD